MRPILFFTFFFLAISFNGLAQEKVYPSHRFYNNFDDPAQNSSWMNSNTIILSNDSSRKFVSRIDENNPYSAGLEIEIPDDLKRKNFRIEVACSVFVKPATNNKLVISISKNDSSVFWEGIQIGDQWKTNSTEISPGRTDEQQSSEKWYAVKKSTLIPGNIPVDSKVKIFIWNADGKSVTDIDNMDVTFSEIAFPSFLPQ
jgi:hypothetical protein